MDAFKVLGIDQNATQADVKKAYRKLAKQFHPDIKGGNEKQFMIINEAYEKLKGWDPLNYQASVFSFNTKHSEPASSFSGSYSPFLQRSNNAKNEFSFKEQHSFNNHICLVLFTLGLALSFGGYVILNQQYIGLAGVALAFISAMMKVYSTIMEKRNDFEI